MHIYSSVDHCASACFKGQVQDNGLNEYNVSLDPRNSPEEGHPPRIYFPFYAIHHHLWEFCFNSQTCGKHWPSNALILHTVIIGTFSSKFFAFTGCTGCTSCCISGRKSLDLQSFLHVERFPGANYVFGYPAKIFLLYGESEILLIMLKYTVGHCIVFTEMRTGELRLQS